MLGYQKQRSYGVGIANIRILRLMGGYINKYRTMNEDARKFGGNTSWGRYGVHLLKIVITGTLVTKPVGVRSTEGSLT